jgi:hypothetical protein
MSAIGEERNRVVDNEGKQEIFINSKHEITNEETTNKGIVDGSVECDDYND